MRTQYKYYVAVRQDGRDVKSFSPSPDADTQVTTWGIANGYLYSIGPFRTRRGAEFMAVHGNTNPHCRDVREAEKLAKKLAKQMPLQ